MRQATKKKIKVCVCVCGVCVCVCDCVCVCVCVIVCVSVLCCTVCSKSTDGWDVVVDVARYDVDGTDVDRPGGVLFVFRVIVPTVEEKVLQRGGRTSWVRFLRYRTEGVKEFFSTKEGVKADDGKGGERRLHSALRLNGVGRTQREGVCGRQSEKERRKQRNKEKRRGV